MYNKLDRANGKKEGKKKKFEDGNFG